MQSPGISRFGTLRAGAHVERITLRAGDLTVGLLTLGAILQSVRLDGVDHDLTLGSDQVSDYEAGMIYHGALVGPVVNRLTGGRAPIAGQPHRFEANQDGLHSLHSGRVGTWAKVWTLAEVTQSSATLTLHLPGGEGGFPGNRRITARFSLHAPATLRMEVTATTDAPTLLNFANHSYWNLDGTPNWAGHSLRIAADHMLPTTDSFAPTGKVMAVDGTPFDFRTARKITPGAPAMDNAFCLADARRDLREVLWLTGTSGVTLTLATTEPSVQIYDDRNARPGYQGLAIEAQGWPDAPNHAGFPSIEVGADDAYHQITEWRLSRAL